VDNAPSRVTTFLGDSVGKQGSRLSMGRAGDTFACLDRASIYGASRLWTSAARAYPKWANVTKRAEVREAASPEAATTRTNRP